MQFSSGWDVKVYCNILTTNDESIVTKVAKPSYYYNINQLCSSSSRRNDQWADKQWLVLASKCNEAKNDIPNNFQMWL